MTVQLWLNNLYSHFEKGLAVFDKDHVEDIHAIIHQGMLVDTALLATTGGMSYSNFILRWKISEEGIHIYDADPEITHILFINCGKKSVFVDGYEIKRKGSYTLQLK